MNLLEIVKEHQQEIIDKAILVEYGLYRKELAKNHCKFVIDECEELEALNDVILNLMAKDNNAEIYVNTYGIDFAKETPVIYADSLWIITEIEIEGVRDLFKFSPQIEPTDVVSVVENEAIDGIISLVVLGETKVKKYCSFISDVELSRVKSLYWD